MRSRIHARRLRSLSKASAIVLLGGFVAACSNDATRFEEVLTTNSTMTANQHAILHKSVATSAPQAYPGDVGDVTTGSIQHGIRVSRPAPIASQPLTPLANSRTIAPQQVVRDVPVQTYQPAARTPIATPVPAAPKGALVLKPRASASGPLKVVGTDPVSTGSVAPAAPAAPKGGRTGWTGGGGTWVSVGPGETLYNLSNRYGVPVSAIMDANNIRDAGSLAAGSRIIIPAYTYNSSANVSAPDNDPITRASRASNGFRGQVRGERVPTPTARATPPRSEPVQQVVVGATSGSHTVTSGQTLYGVSRQYNVSISALRAANNLDGDTIRVGQSLRIPGATTALAQTDPIKTGSVPSTQSQEIVRPKTPAKPIAVTNRQTASIGQRSGENVDAPKSTSSGAFRWPTRGRVIAKFGERINGSVNDGIDISVPSGTPIKAAENGTVIYSGSELADFGNLILVSHSGGWVSAYAHSSQNKVKRGDKVKRGQIIAISGKSGNAKTPRVHFELRKDSNPVNPLKHLSG